MYRLAAITLLTTLLAGHAMAGDSDGARWYRYYNDNNQPSVSDRVTEEHISRGYDALDKNMQLLRHVPPQRRLTPEELAAAKAARSAEAKRKEDDQQLLRLYSRPSDAEHSRDRQLEAIQLRIDFSTSSLARLRDSRTQEAQRAAVLERTGKPVPAPLKDSIANYDRQIQKLQTEIKARKAEQEKVRADFAPVIQRLQELTGAAAAPKP